MTVSLRLTIQAATHSKKGEHKLHANEDRYTARPHGGQSAPLARPSLATGSLSGCIRRRGAALSTREERPVTADPTKEGRPPLSHAPPKSPFSLPLRLTIQAHADFNEELPKSAAVAALYPGGALGGPDGCTVAPPSNAFFGVYIDSMVKVAVLVGP